MGRAWRYSLHGYRLRRRTDTSLFYRAGMDTLLFRLRITVLAGLLTACVAGIYYGGLADYGSSASNTSPAEDAADAAAHREAERLVRQMEQRLSPEAKRRVARDREAHRRYLETSARTLRNTRRWMRIGAWSLMGLLIAIGLFHPLSMLWESITLECPSPGRLRIRSWSLWPRRRTVNLADYGYPTLGVVEMKNTNPRRIRPKSTFAYVLKFPYRGAMRSGRNIEFWLRSLSARPEPGQPIGPEYKEFVVPLCELTNLRLD